MQQYVQEPQHEGKNRPSGLFSAVQMNTPDSTSGNISVDAATNSKSNDEVNTPINTQTSTPESLPCSCSSNSSPFDISLLEESSLDGSTQDLSAQPTDSSVPAASSQSNLPAFLAELPTMTTNNMDPATQQLLIQAYIKLLDTLSGTPSAPVQVPSSPAFAAPVTPSRMVGDRYLVYVHGISQHSAGYSDAWWSALQPYVGLTYGTGELGDRRQEVIWSDLVNAARAAEMSRAVGVDVEKERLRQEITTVLQERQQQEIAKNTKSVAEAQQAARQTSVAERGSGMAIDDFLIYMTDSKMRQQIIDRFTKVVGPLLQNNNRVDIICHSWGTVVAYEGLRELEKNPAIPGKVL
ncbi:MAG TPA: hypothetical protein V6C65_13715, partial [Allocoleopsis sp.]